MANRRSTANFMDDRKALDLAQLTTFVPQMPTIASKSKNFYLLAAPFAALGALSPSEKKISKAAWPLRQRCIRIQAGLNNRWQFPYDLSCDLLGAAQASKAYRAGLNETLRRIMTADTPVSLFDESEDLAPNLKVQTQLCKTKTTLSQQVQKDSKLDRLQTHLPSTKEVLFSHTQKLGEDMDPDVSLKCLGFLWDLHRIYLFKSKTLSQLLITAVESSSPSDLESIKGNKYNNQSSLAAQKSKEYAKENPKLRAVTISLDIQDPEITRVGFAIALKNLYNTEPEVEEADVLAVLAAASVLQFPSLFQKCVSIMKNGISSANVCSYYSAACKYKQENLKTDCERWLELNLVSHLGFEIHLQNLPQELLHKVLKSPRLFTFSEFSLLKTTLCWVFLQLNPKVQIIPSHEKVLMYFSSLPKRCSFLERDIGQRYIAIFQSLRLHGITSSKHLKDLQKINFFPVPWLTQILSNHYHALESGGDMPFQKDFSTQAVRFGLVLKQEPRYHEEIISIYGFFFEIKAIRHEASMYSFYIKRVKHTDPVLSFLAAECNCVSLRQEREVKYEIKAHYLINGKWREFSTDKLTQKFGVTKPSCKSQVLKAWIPSIPIYVTYALLFPSS